MYFSIGELSSRNSFTCQTVPTELIPRGDTFRVKNRGKIVFHAGGWIKIRETFPHGRKNPAATSRNNARGEVLQESRPEVERLPRGAIVNAWRNKHIRTKRGSSSVVSNTRHLGFRAKTRSLKEGGELESSVRRESFVCSSPPGTSFDRKKGEEKKNRDSLSLSFSFSTTLSTLSVSKTRSFEEFSAPLAKLGGI